MIGWVCIFLMISSSLTTEGLRHRFPRPIPLRRLHEDQCGSVVRIDCLDSEVRSVRVHQRRHAALRLPICAQLTDDQLLKKLKDVGGYNPIYVAINITEALKFKDPRTFEKEKPKKPKATRAPDCGNHPTPPPTTASPTTRHISTELGPSTSTPPTTTTFPTTLRQIFTELPSRMTRTPPIMRRPQRAQYAKEEELKKMSLLEKLVLKKTDDFKDDARLVRKLVKRRSAVDSCWLKGSYVDGSRNRRVHMCSECRVMTHLAGNEMPQYINEVACGHDLSADSGQAAHDDQCYASAGLCAQKVLRFPAMKRSGYVRHPALSAIKGVEIYVERWVTSTKDIRAGCKCEMYNSHAQLLKGLNG